MISFAIVTAKYTNAKYSVVRRIQPTLISNAPQQSQGFGSSTQTAGQKRMHNTINRIYSDPQHQY